MSGWLRRGLEALRAAARGKGGGARRRWQVAVAALHLVPLAALAFVLWPLPEGLLDRRELVSTRIVDRNGGLLRELRSRADGRSVPLQGPIPPLVRAAFLAAEDARFDSHPGIDPLAIGRAALQNLRAGRVVSGASTIPQQLARALVPRERTLLGKAGEALWALRLVAHLPRERILREYLDRVPLGNSVFGVEAAARFYFGRPAAHLSAGQAALLAGMARSPARLDPFRHEAAARARMEAVLARMEALGALDAEERRVAVATPLDLVPARRAFEAPHLVAWLAGALEELGIDGAARVETTIDPALQADVEAMLREEVAALADHRVTQAAALVVDNATGEILAWVGSVDFLDEAAQGQNDGVRALRQPGSTLKPFAYGLALADGATAATVLSDVETHLATPSGDYVPRNYDRRVHGPVRLRAALANSYNVPAVRLAEQVDPGRLLDLLRRAGFASLTEDAAHYGVGLVLGNGDVTMLELAAAYRGLARGGVAAPITAIRRAWDAAGATLPLARREERRFLPAEVVHLLTDILSDEAARAPAFGLDNALRLPFPVAAKTGTSRAWVDNWTAGYTAERTVVVWVGNFDGRSMRGVSGITGAGPLFRRVMIRAMEGIRPAPLLDGSAFTERTICPLSGQLAGPACAGAFEEIFLPGTEPTATCEMHRLAPVDAAGRPVPCGAPAAGVAPVLDVGPGFYAWARGEGLSGAPVPRCGEEAGAGRAQILSPGDGDEYLIEAGLPPGSQSVPVRLLLPAGATAAELRTGDGKVIPLAPPFTTRLPAVRGSHRLELWLPGAAAPAAVSRYVVR